MARGLTRSRYRYTENGKTRTGIVLTIVVTMPVGQVRPVGMGMVFGNVPVSMRVQRSWRRLVMVVLMVLIVVAVFVIMACRIVAMGMVMPVEKHQRDRSC